jgi:hypothetical protein
MVAVLDQYHDQRCQDRAHDHECAEHLPSIIFQPQSLGTAAYGEALKARCEGAVRYFRIVEGLD